MKRRDNMLTGVILAGGQNSRMNGYNKALLSFSNETLIERQLRIMDSICTEIIIVTHTPSSIQPFAGHLAHLIPDDIVGKGPLSGMHAALSHTTYDDLWIVECDMPFISAEAAKLQLEI